MNGMKIGTEDVVTYETHEAAQSLRNCLWILEGYEHGFQGVVEQRDNEYVLAVYDTYLRPVGYVCHA